MAASGQSFFCAQLALTFWREKSIKLKSMLVGTAIFAAAAAAHAGTFGVALNETAPGFWTADYDSDHIVGLLLGGAPHVAGTDTITFQDFLAPLTPGQYDVELTFHELANTTHTTDPINVASANINGLPIDFITKRTFVIDGIAHPPFVLTLTGSTNIPDAGYHGTMTVTAVPEPETYAMFLAGLGMMGRLARRRKTQQAQLHSAM
jgi:hypothetical protein